MSNILLSVNIDHIATLRNARNTIYPDPIQAAFIVEQAGSDGITIHLREDRRHITDRDVILLRKIIHSNMNLELAVTKEMINIACELKPDSCCLVPENRHEITTEGGLNLLFDRNKLSDVIARFSSVGIDVSLFIDADKRQIDAAADLGVHYIELHTGPYSMAKNNVMRISKFEQLEQCARYAISLGLKVNAGHGLDYHNVRLISTLPLHMLHIGHAIVSRSVFYGLFTAVKDMKNILTINSI